MRSEQRLSKMEQRVRQQQQSIRWNEQLYNELRALPREELYRLHREAIEDAPRTPEQVAYYEWLRTLTPEEMLREYRAGL